MYVYWINNGVERQFNLQGKRVLSKLRKAVKKHVHPEDTNTMAKVVRAETIADLCFAVYYLRGTPEFEEFCVTSE